MSKGTKHHFDFRVVEKYKLILTCALYIPRFFIITITHGRDAGVQSVSDKQKNGTRRANNLSGPLSLPTRASANSLSAPIQSSAGRI